MNFNKLSTEDLHLKGVITYTAWMFAISQEVKDALAQELREIEMEIAKRKGEEETSKPEDQVVEILKMLRYPKAINWIKHDAKQIVRHLLDLGWRPPNENKGGSHETGSTEKTNGH